MYSETGRWLLRPIITSNSNTNSSNNSDSSVNSSNSNSKFLVAVDLATAIFHTNNSQIKNL